MTATSNTPTDPPTFDTKDIAALLRCSEKHVRDLVKRGEFIAPLKLGALVRWDRAAVLRWLDENTGRRVDRAGKTAQVRG